MPYLTGYTLKTYNKGQIWHFMSAVLQGLQQRRRQCPCLRTLTAYGSMAEDAAGGGHGRKYLYEDEETDQQNRNENGKQISKATTVQQNQYKIKPDTG